MNKKELTEIKKQLSSNTKTSFGELLTAYVGSDKEIKFVKRNMFMGLPEMEILMYLELFKKSLGGSIGKNLLELQFPVVNYADCQSKTNLYELTKSELKDDDLNREFVEGVVDKFDYAGEYYIMALSCSYPIPHKGKDTDEDGEDSEYLYDFILTAICPVNKVERGLCFMAEKNAVEKNYSSEMEVGKPMHGFLFPVFNEREADANSVMYFTAKPKEPSTSIIEGILGCKLELSANEQQERFNNMLSRVLGDDSTYNITSAIHSSINEIINNNVMETQPVTLNQDEIKKILEDSGVDDDNMEAFEDIYEEEIGEGVSLTAVNITDESAMKVGSTDIKISVKPNAADKVEAKLVDGKRCLVIAIDETVKVNGLPVLCK